MILGIGTDITSVDRFNNSRQHMDRLADKILTDYEWGEYQKLNGNHGNFLAKRWAVKEAVSKAFGTGISGDTRWKSIEVRHNQHTGAPTVCFYNKLRESVEVLGARCHITLSDEGTMVAAFAVIEYKN